MSKNAVLMKNYISEKDIFRLVARIRRCPEAYPLSQECREEMRKMVYQWVEKQKGGRKSLSKTPPR